jgi:site-specific recombinase XerC
MNAGFGDPTEGIVISQPPRVAVIELRPNRALGELREFVDFLDDTPIGLRDRAILGLYYCSLASFHALAEMNTTDVAFEADGTLMHARVPGAQILWIPKRKGINPMSWLEEWVDCIGRTGGKKVVQTRAKRSFVGDTPQPLSIIYYALRQAIKMTAIDPRRSSGWNLRVLLTEPPF